MYQTFPGSIRLYPDDFLVAAFGNPLKKQAILFSL